MRKRRAIEEAFVGGYRAVLWVAFGLAAASSLSAAVLIGTETRPEPSIAANEIKVERRGSRFAIEVVNAMPIALAVYTRQRPISQKPKFRIKR